MRIILLFPLLFFSLLIYGQQQKREVRGIVQDTSGIPLEGVNVRLVSVIDTLSASTNREGQFFFKEVSGLEFRIYYSLLGYQIRDEHYAANPFLPKVELVNVKLRPQATLLKEVNIYGVQPILIKEDTIQYNADAYFVRDGDLVEDLMKQFPGVEIYRNGRVVAQGQTVARVKVNGKDFFTGDVLTATRNLPANIVENIQVIDDYGEHANLTGVKNSDPEKIINITLKKDRNRGMFGQVTGGLGTDYRYLSSISANSFDDTQQFSILGSTNNTNASLFSFGDVSGAGARDRNIDLNSTIEMNDGINQTNSLGVNYRDDISSKTSANGSYVYTNRQNKTTSTNFVQSIYRNNIILSDEAAESTNKEYVHKLNWNIESKPNKRTYLKVSPTLSFGKSDLFTEGQGTIKNRRLTTERSSNSDENQRSPNFNLEVFLNRNFSKPGRNLSMNMVSNLNSNKKKDYINDYRINIDSGLISPLVKVEKLYQTISNEQINNDFQFQVSYIEPITKFSFLEINYEYNISANGNNRNAKNVGQFDADSVVSDSLFINYEYKFQTNKIGFIYQYKHQKFNYQIGFGLQPTQLSGYTLNQDISTTSKNMNFVPSARFTYKIDQYSSLSLAYLGQNNQPEFYQIQPVRDISNQQHIIVGNPELQSEFSSNLSFQFRKFNLISGNAFFSNLSFKSIQNKIVAQRTVIPNSTKQETSFLNTSGYFDTHVYYLYSISLLEKVLNVSISGSADYNNNISFINMEKNKGRNLNFVQGLKVNYMMEDWFTVDLRSSFSLNRTRNSIPAMFNTDANTLALGLGGKTYVKKWSMSFDVSTRINNGFSNSVKANPTLLNVYLERTFLKNDRGVIRLQGFDLMNQNTGISREVSGNEIYDVRNDRLGRYFLISFNLRLQKFPKIK